MKQRVDLLPQTNSIRKTIRNRVLMWVVMLLVVLSGLLVASDTLSRKADSYERENVVPQRFKVQSMETQEIRLAALTSELKAGQEKALDESARAERLEAFLREPAWADLVSDLVDSTSEALLLTEINISKPRSRDASAQGAASPSAMLSVSGRASSSPDVVSFVSKFAQSPHMETFQMGFSQASSGGSEQVEFEASGTVR